MEITLSNIGRRFNREWIFKGVNFSFAGPGAYAILGRNGSGKSTLLQIIAGNLSPSQGDITAVHNSREINPDELFNYLSIAAPYLELIEEFSLKEMIDFHFKFKPVLASLDSSSIIELLELGHSKNKAIKYFSSGMKQRTKLALAVCSNTPLLLLDEPTANLDTQGIDWYLKLISQYANNRLVLVCSNQEHEYSFCAHQLKIADYKS